MPLIKCNECDKEISDSAGVCPHCGAEIELTIEKNKKKKACKKTIIKVVAVIGVLLVLRVAYVQYQNYKWRKAGGSEMMRELNKSMRELQRLNR